MSRSPLSVTRFRLIFSICFLALMADHVLVLHWLGMPWKVAIIDSAISNGILLLACLLIMNTLRYYLPRREQYINIFAWCILLTFVWAVICRWLLHITLGQYENYNNLLHHSLAIRFSIGLLLLGLITLICVLWFNWGEQKENEDRRLNAERLAR